MSLNTSNGTIQHAGGDALSLVGVWDIKVIRADGRIETKQITNIVTRAGMNRIANRAVLGTSTPFYVLAIGTATAAHSADSGQGNLGEVIRKSAALVSNSREWIFLQCTVGGFADSVTSVALASGALADFPNSHASTGILGNMVNDISTTLANSDVLDLTVRIRVGSHNLSHST